MSKPRLCFYCWRQTPPADLIFSCPICASPAENGHPLVRSIGPRRVSRMVPWWKRPFGIRLHKVPCPLHRTTRPTYLCPACEHPVDIDATIGARRIAGLGIAGSRGSGKTLMMLGALPNLGVPGNGRAFHIVPIGDTELRFTEAREKKLAGGRPVNTDPHEPQEGYAWRASAADDPDDPEQLLLMSDLGGEVWTNEKGKEGATRERVDQYAALLNKVVLVIDGAGIAADLLLPANDAWDDTPRARTFGRTDVAVLGNLLDRFGEARASEIELALAISKGDLLWNQSQRLLDCGVSGGTTLYDAPVRELLNESYRGDLLTWGRKFKDYRTFIFSSLGFRPGKKDIDPQTGKLRRQPDPVGVSAPIRWLLNSDARNAE